MHKACRLLRALSDQRNNRLTAIAAAAGADKATSMRLLDVLASEAHGAKAPARSRVK